MVNSISMKEYTASWILAPTLISGQRWTWRIFNGGLPDFGNGLMNSVYQPGFGQLSLSKRLKSGQSAASDSFRPSLSNAVQASTGKGFE